MKKLLLIAGVVALTASTQVFAQEVAPGPCPCRARFEAPAPQFHHRPMYKPHCDMKKFESELNLTAEQKEQTKKLRDAADEKIKPLREEIKSKHQEMENIFNERLTVKERQDKLAPINKEIWSLKKQIHKIRMEERKEFKALLTDKQIKVLDKKKQEFRKNFKKGPNKCHRMHKRPPMPRPLPCNCQPKPQIAE